jgi:hypothetical protein
MCLGGKCQTYTPPHTFGVSRSATAREAGNFQQKITRPQKYAAGANVVNSCTVKTFFV